MASGYGLPLVMIDYYYYYVGRCAAAVWSPKRCDLERVQQHVCSHSACWAPRRHEPYLPIPAVTINKDVRVGSRPEAQRSSMLPSLTLRKFACSPAFPTCRRSDTSHSSRTLRESMSYHLCMNIFALCPVYLEGVFAYGLEECT